MAYFPRSSVHPLLSNFAAGYSLGALMDETSAKRKGGKALANLFAGEGEPVEAPPAVRPPAAAPGMGPGVDEIFGEEKATEAISQQQGKLPSTRDWTRFTTEALRSVQNQGPDAVVDMQDKILKFQQTHVLRNLGAARSLLAQGRDEEAGPYLERAAAFIPDFSVLITAPARMQDGSTKLAVAPHDEQTGEPNAPGMIATEQAIGQLMELFSDPKNVMANNRAARMAEEKLGLALRKERRDIERYPEKLDIEREKVDISRAEAETRRMALQGRQRETPKTKVYTLNDALKSFNNSVKDFTGETSLRPGRDMDMEDKRNLRERFIRSFRASKDKNSPFYGLSPRDIAEELIKDYRNQLAKEVAKKPNAD